MNFIKHSKTGTKFTNGNYYFEFVLLRCQMYLGPAHNIVSYT